MPKRYASSGLPSELSRAAVPDELVVLLVLGLHALEVAFWTGVLLAVDDEGRNVKVVRHVVDGLADLGRPPIKIIYGNQRSSWVN